MKYKPTIGLEIHAELKTKTKMFCSSLNDPDEKHPNVNICPVCLGYPGTLPVINEEAIQKVILAGLALNCAIARETNFDRKNYFYPDLPKGYQISQYQRPLCAGGFLEAGGKKMRITRIHLEEDAGRLQHPIPSSTTSDGASGARGAHSLVDFNRAGVPLMELVTEPDFETGEEVMDFAKKLQLILRYLQVSEANMEKGQMRVEVNISLHPEGSSSLGTKVEVKNLNSIRVAVAAVDYEIKRQTILLEKGEKIVQETRGWDDQQEKTFSQRIKESAHDYRYFPEPDLPVLRFSEEDIKKIMATMPELPEQRRSRFLKVYGLNKSQVEIFMVAKHLGDYYEKVASELDEAASELHRDQNEQTESHLPNKLHTLAANYMITEFPPLMQAQGWEIDDLAGFKIEPEAFAELMVMIFHQKLSSTAAKMVLKAMAETGLHPEAIAKEKNLLQVSDSGELQKIAAEIIARNPQAVEDYKNGKTEVIKFLVGQVMAATKGQANPRMAESILVSQLGS